MLLRGFHFLSDSNRVILCVLSTLLKPSALFLCCMHCAQQKILFRTIKLVFMSEETVIVIYLFIFVVAASAPLLYLLARRMCA